MRVYQPTQAVRCLHPRKDARTHTPAGGKMLAGNEQQRSLGPRRPQAPHLGLQRGAATPVLAHARHPLDPLLPRPPLARAPGPHPVGHVRYQILGHLCYQLEVAAHLSFRLCWQKLGHLCYTRPWHARRARIPSTQAQSLN